MSENLIPELINHITSKSYQFRQTLKQIEKSNGLYLTGLTGSARSLFVSYLANHLNRPILLIAPDITTALKYAIDMPILTGKDANYLPSQEASPYQLVYTDSAVAKQQLSLLKAFKNGESKFLVTSAKTLLNTYLSEGLRNKYSIKLEIGQNADPYDIVSQLVELGYRRVTTVMDPGEFSLRGDILDIYPIGEDAVRIEFWGDEVQSIRNFDTETQRSVKKAVKAMIEPRYKVIVPEDKKQEFIHEVSKIAEKQQKKLPDEFKDTINATLENIISSFETETYFEGIEYFAPVLNEKHDDLTDYIPKNTLIIFHESAESEQKLHIQDEKYQHEYESNINEGLAIELPEFLHRKPDEVLKKLGKFDILNLDSFIQDEEQAFEEIECQRIKNFMANLDEASNYIYELRKSNTKVLVVTEFPQRVAEVLSEWECPSTYLEPDKEYNIDKILKSGDILISKFGFTEGFILPEFNFAVLTDSELFNRRVKKPTIARKTSKRENIDFLVSLNDLNEGDFVVHTKHGIGKFIGLSKQKIDGEEKDYLTIEYASNDKLHMPAEQINLLSRYRGAGTPPKLTRMGGVEWGGIKKKVKKAIVDIAQDLLNLYAKRAKVTGFRYDTDSPWQLEMEDAFPYTETPDQMQAIIESKQDMESEKPMDRLICGDVGFGKTEVAIRAAFKAVLSGKQVAILVPTTILAQQHFQNFSDRFNPYPVKVELLSRFRTPKQQKETVNNLIKGEVDIVVGTHRLLSKDIQFKDLGLVIIDEEHRFGVVHKEKLKHLRAQVDVMTLSATPIPRTLYMALSGIRDMSLINTPPVNRAPVKTYVGTYNESMLRTAIHHELEREGQVYFVHNRVQSIYKVADDLKKLIPEARIAVGHGQMSEKELEKVMYEFSAHEYDILICTTIIESGLDIPNANTIIIDDADKFGLAQMYQMRGRVGRSDAQAYAYCFYGSKDSGKVLTKEAKDRLKAIKDFSTLGSGYHIALRDLEIRGVGNILGSQQHGSMVAVGFDLYCNLLDEAVQELQGEKVEKKEPTIIDINITAYIPDNWVGDKEQKMIEYKRLADVQSIRELEILEEEWRDRFGEIPVEVQRLVKIIKLRLLASDIGINLVREANGVIRIFTDYDMPEWRRYQSAINPKISGKIRWTKAPVSTENAKSILLLNNLGLNNEELLNILEQLFYHILGVQNNKDTNTKI